MADDSAQEKTERATPRRREQARDKGQVAKSQELNSALMVLGGITTLYFFGPFVSSHLMSLMRVSMGHAYELATMDSSFVKHFGDTLAHMLTILLPIFGVMVVIGFSTNVAQVGFKISKKALEPKWEKLNLIKGLKNKFSTKTLFMMVRDTVKLAVISTVAYVVISNEFESFFALPDMSVAQLAAVMGQKALWVTLKVGVAILALSIIDFAYQRYDYEKSIKMSHQELKEEFKDTDGNPQVKSQIRRLQREMSRRSMMAAVPEADVVVTNPTHLAVALKYAIDSMGAPTVIAKGERLIAQRIKEIAREHDIPVIEDKPLARSLFKLCDIGDFVPESLFRAVAEVLAYVYRLKGKGINS